MNCASVPVTAAAIWLLGRTDLVARQALWLLLVVLSAAFLVSTFAQQWFELRPSRARLHARIALQLLGTTVVIYMTGWGPMLAVGFVLVAHEILSAVGSRAWRPILGWSLIAVAGGQVAIAVGLAPSLLAEPAVHGLAVLAALGTALVVSLLGLSALRAEEAESSLRQSQQRLRTTIETSKEAYIEIDEDGRVTEWNAQAETTFGWGRADATGRLLEELIIPQPSRAAHRQGLARFAAAGDGAVFGRRLELVALHRDGHEFPVELAIWATPTAGGCRFNAFAHDISERRRAETALRDSEESFRLLFAHHPHPMWVHDLETLAFVEVNDAAIAHYGFSREEFISMRIDDIRREEEHPALHEALAAAGDGVQFGGVWRHQTKSGELIDVEITSHRLDFNGRPSGLIMAQDVTERLRVERALAHQAVHDALTGLPNRTLLLDRLDQALARSHRSHLKAAVIYIDLDRFKVINDGKGHGTGDRLLIQVAARMSGALRPGDTVARIGGDEFVVVLEGIADEAEAAAASGRISWALDRPFVIDGSELFVSASQGIALADAGDSPEELLGKADVAMYRAKDRGRARSEFADDEHRAKASSRFDLESALRQALERGEFVIHYQPVVEVATGRIVGAEALVRWHHPERGLLAPDQFIVEAEECGLIVPIGEWVLRQAMEDATRWAPRPDGEPLSIAVNLSAVQLAVRNLPFKIARMLSTSGLDPSRLHLEITESVLMQDVDRSVAVLNALRELGVRVDVDDFGTGYSSLSYVQRLPVDTLKIDKSFVDRLDGTDDDSIVEAIVSLGRSLQLTVVAEGVESDHQRQRLFKLGCEFAQGYHYARPVPLAEFNELLGRGRLNSVQPSDRGYMIAEGVT